MNEKSNKQVEKVTAKKSISVTLTLHDDALQVVQDYCKDQIENNNHSHFGKEKAVNILLSEYSKMKKIHAELESLESTDKLKILGKKISEMSNEDLIFALKTSMASTRNYKSMYSSMMEQLGKINGL